MGQFLLPLDESYRLRTTTATSTPLKSIRSYLCCIYKEKECYFTPMQMVEESIYTVSIVTDGNCL